MKRSAIILLTCAVLCMSLFFVSCKKSSGSSTSSNNPGGNNPGSNLYGSGSLSFTAGSLGNLSFSGSWTGVSVGSSGTAVEALTGTSGSDHAAIIYAYDWHSSNNWDNAMLDLTSSTAIAPGTYTTNTGLLFFFTKGSTSATDNSNEYL